MSVSTIDRLTRKKETAMDKTFDMYIEWMIDNGANKKTSQNKRGYYINYHKPIFGDLEPEKLNLDDHATIFEVNGNSNYAYRVSICWIEFIKFCRWFLHDEEEPRKPQKRRATGNTVIYEQAKKENKVISSPITSSPATGEHIELDFEKMEIIYTHGRLKITAEIVHQEFI